MQKRSVFSNIILIHFSFSFLYLVMNAIAIMIETRNWENTQTARILSLVE